MKGEKFGVFTRFQVTGGVEIEGIYPMSLNFVIYPVKLQHR